MQVIHVRSEASVSEALKVSSYVDALLLDSGNPSLQVKELGGTGRVHDWQISRRIREELTVPVFLAGGLRASKTPMLSSAFSRSASNFARAFVWTGISMQQSWRNSCVLSGAPLLHHSIRSLMPPAGWPRAGPPAYDFFRGPPGVGKGSTTAGRGRQVSGGSS